MVSHKKIHIKTIIINPPNKFCRPKKINGQEKFNNNWIKKKVKGTLFSLVIPSFINNKNELIIKIYKTIQTGVKIQSGGVKKGLFKLLYQSMFCIYLV